MATIDGTMVGVQGPAAGPFRHDLSTRNNQKTRRKLPKMTESALAAIEVALIIKTKVYRSLNMGVLQGGGEPYPWTLPAGS